MVLSERTSAYLVKTYINRLDWAEKGKINFFNSLQNKDIKLQVANMESSRCDIVVYGRPQTGKTTLILKLMGVSPQHEKKLHEILRATRPKGSSSSISAMIFSLSDKNDEYFYWRFDNEFNEERLAEHELSIKIREIRRSIEEKKFVNSGIVHLKIPRKYFIHYDKKKPQLKIIDLPGKSSSDQYEEQYVNKLFSRYIPSASLIILVSIVSSRNDLLHPVQGMANWWDAPFKYRLVMTKSASDLSLREYLQKNILKDRKSILKKSYIDYYIKSISLSMKRKGRAFPTQESLLYPLDCGDSWQTLKDKHPKFYSEMKTVMNELFEEFRNDLYRHTSKYYQLKAPMNLYKHLEGFAKNELSQLNQKKSLNEESKKEILEFLNAKKNKLTTLENRNSRIVTRKISFNSISLFSFQYKESDTFGPEIRRGLIKKHLDKMITKLVQESDFFVKKFNEQNEFHISSNLNIYKSCREIADKFNERVKGIWFDVKSGDFKEKFVDRCNNVSKDMINEAKRLVNKEVEEKLNDYNEGIENKAKLNQPEIIQLKKELNSLRNEVATIDQNIDNIHGLIKKWNTTYQRDKEESKKYLNYLSISFRKEREIIKRKIFTSNLEVKHQFFEIFNLFLITKELKELIKLKL